MELNEKYLTERLKSLEERKLMAQQQLGQLQQQFAQMQANINAIDGAIFDTKEMLGYLKQTEPEKDETSEQKVVEMKPEGVTNAKGTAK
jgi:hypothetical protein